MKLIDASMSEDMSRTGTPQNHDSDSEGNEGAGLVMRNKRGGFDQDRDQRSSHSSAGGSTMSPGVPASLSSLNSSGGMLSSVQPSTVSLGPPLPPPPHLLPYLYPGAGLYPGGPSLHQLSQLLHPPGMLPGGSLGAHGAGGALGMSHNLLLNAQLALAAQHQLFHPHAYQNLSAASLAAAASAGAAGSVTPPSIHHHPTVNGASALVPPSERLRAHRFTPYSLGGSAASPSSKPSANSGGGGGGLLGLATSSAFEAVSPKVSPLGAAQTRLQSSPPILLSNASNEPPPPPPPAAKPTQPPAPTSTPASDLKNIEKMVNGLEMTKSESNVVHEPKVAMDK